MLYEDIRNVDVVSLDFFVELFFLDSLSTDKYNAGIWTAAYKAMGNSSSKHKITEQKYNDMYNQST